MKIDTAIIMNPSANDWEARKKWPAMTQLLEKYGIAYTLIETRPDAKTVEMAREAAQKGYGRVVAVGGDGTINEVFNGIMKAGVSRKPRVALIPFGTANDISKSFKIRVEDLDECIRTLVDGLDYPLDLGLVDGERYFADAFTIGYDASVLKDRNMTRGKRLLMTKGIGSYIPSLLKEFFFYRKARATIGVDGKIFSKKIYNLIVKNTRTYAGNFVLNERIRGNDGLLDVFLFQQGVRYWSELGAQVTKQVSEVTDPTGISKSIVDTVIKNYEDYQAREVEIALSTEVDSQVDGEQYRTADHFTVRCIRRALTLQVPYPY